MSGKLQSLFFQSSDGLNLHALVQEEEPGRRSGAPPVVCLPGLTRPARDFVVLGSFLRARSNRRVVSLDYRGRGGSDWDPDWTHYNFPTELADILTVLEALGIGSAIFVGLSRGGLHAIILANQRPDIVKAMVLADVGPQIEVDGLARIRQYVGKLPLLRDLDAAVAHYKSVLGPFFPSVPDEHWRFYAQNSLNQTPERLRLSYDPQLARTLDNFDPTKPLPDFWPQFAAVQAPILALRAEHSDVLAPEVHAEMAARHPLCQTHVVPGQGHAPFLLDFPTLERIAEFIDETDSAA
ncbi:alpha/beta hydrolase [Rhodoblastus acidophilus]|uniref:Alpha/beta hydrolase n=1 Tax=Candidatus Rhodoblastus alkanivorans TaxID=2954117 RepID=A0ABS9Z6H3_9HYPH|nr:alpha/beta hydrolase [Candidatus Rhodoblastus alkanivorans]MCI4680102.1 alpha/beta hydrolase [Candidatus Rhodoblastus alkanivorans]MCI4682980.1 alpha/beta hydrolase [Candidatus Rhodoblastus alkanivorans]MDI4640290.1 alpha/beta hydrolase [Rhodoblastus acidophilus]